MIRKIAIYHSWVVAFLGPLLLSAQDSMRLAGFRPYGMVGGYFFGDFAYKPHADALNRGSVEYSNMPKDQSFFNLRRVYLSYDYYFSPQFTSELILSYEGQSAATSNRNVFIKVMDIRWKEVFKRTDFVFGQMLTPTFALTEKQWGYRSIEKTIADMRSIAFSSDLGFSVQGRFNDQGTYGYNLMLSNGTGLRPETDKYKKIYFNLYAKLLSQKLIIDLHTDYERGSLQQGMHKARQTYKIGVVYQAEKFTIGSEFFEQEHKNYVTAIHLVGTDSVKTYANESTIGFSVFARGKLREKIFAYLRYDHYNPDARFSPQLIYMDPYDQNREDFFVAGLDFQPIEKVHLMPNIWYNHYHHKMGYKIEKVLNDYDLVARCTVWVVFK